MKSEGGLSSRGRMPSEGGEQVETDRTCWHKQGEGVASRNRTCVHPGSKREDSITSKKNMLQVWIIEQHLWMLKLVQKLFLYGKPSQKAKTAIRGCYCAINLKSSNATLQKSINAVPPPNSSSLAHPIYSSSGCSESSIGQGQFRRHDPTMGSCSSPPTERNKV